MAVPRILIIVGTSEGPQTGAQVRAILQREARWQVDIRETPVLDGTAASEPPPDLVIPVLPISAERAEAPWAALRGKGLPPPMLPVVPSDGVDQVLTSLSHWAKDFLVLPLEPAEVVARVRRLLPKGEAPVGGRAAGRPPDPAGLEGLVGEHPAFLAVKRKIPRIAHFEASVLLTGETGTGKERCARALHYVSRRAAKPFLPVNCGAIPVELFERELFGHEKGAFTGAWAAQSGLVGEAERGTLFLDEIETLSLNAQAKLLRFLQDQTYRSLGSPRARQANVWVLAATNENLLYRVQEGTFREDLYYRLAVMTLILPPLRERREDIPLLVARLWAQLAAREGGEGRQLSPAALEALCRYDWPGNIRELENVLQQAFVLADAQTIEPGDFPLPLQSPAPGPNGESFKQAKARAIEAFEKAYLAELLRQHDGNVTHAAREAQTERRALGRLLKKHQLTPTDHPTAHQQPAAGPRRLPPIAARAKRAELTPDRV